MSAQRVLGFLAVNFCLLACGSGTPVETKTPNEAAPQEASPAAPEESPAPTVPAPKTEDWLPVTRNGRWGYVDRDGKWKIKAQFLEAKFFYGQLAEVRTTQGWAIINAQGELLLPARKYNYYLSDKKVLLKHTAFRGPSKVVHRDGRVVAEGIFAGEICEDNTFFFRDDEKKASGWMSAAGKVVREVPYEVAEAKCFSEGVAAAAYKTHALKLDGTKGIESTRWGYIDEKGKWIVKLNSLIAGGPFSKGVAAAGEYFIDKTGKDVFGLKDKKVTVSDFKGDFAVVKPRQKLGKIGEYGYVIDRQGKKVADNVSFCTDAEGLLICKSARGQQVLDPKGQPVGAIGVPEQVYFLKDDLYLVESHRGRRSGVWQRNKDWFVKPGLFTEAWTVGDKYLIGKGRDQLWSFVEWKAPIPSEQKFQEILTFQEGAFAVQSTDGQWMFIGEDGKQVVPGTFSKAKGFFRGAAWVESPEGEGYVDKSGKWLFKDTDKADRAAVERANQLIEKGKNKEASQLLAKLADAGNPHALYRLALHFRNVNDEAQMLKALNLAAKQDHIPSQHLLLGHKVAKAQKFEPGEFEQLQAQAAWGHPEAQFDLANIYLNGIFGVQKNISAGMVQMKLAADNEHPGAVVAYAIALVEGRFVQKNLNKGAGMLEKAAKGGNAQAYFPYAQMLEAGYGGSKSAGEAKLKAAPWYKKALDAGDQRAAGKVPNTKK